MSLFIKTWLHCSLSHNSSIKSIVTTINQDNRVGIDYPELVVFDLDACFWDQEMYEMSAMPDKTVKGDLNGKTIAPRRSPLSRILVFRLRMESAGDM